MRTILRKFQFFMLAIFSAVIVPDDVANQADGNAYVLFDDISIVLHISPGWAQLTGGGLGRAGCAGH